MKGRIRVRAILATLVALIAGHATAGPGPAGLEGVPRYDHIFVIIDENRDAAEIHDPRVAPNIARLARTFGDATRFYGETHPSEPNYVALVGGDTFGIYDDDPYYCRAASTRPLCEGAKGEGYPDHTVHARQIGDQLSEKGLSWKGYYGALPAPGSMVAIAGDPAFFDGTKKSATYASKHSGFLNFADVQADPKRAQRIVGFDQLDRDLAANALPNFALIVPDQCDDMHGLKGARVPADCLEADKLPLIRRGDRVTGELVRKIQATRAWKSRQNVAIVITFDEGGQGSGGGCCGVTPNARSNFGGGLIPTIVITNHGPRGVKDATPYNHYALLRTIEDAFGISEHLRRAALTKQGVVPMRRLFAVGG